MRRAIDVFVSIAGLVLLAPVLVLIACAVAATSPGPVLYRQERAGLHGRPFQILKFRTMRRDAEVAGAQWAAPNDPRVTPIGRMLRLTRLDELPQLLNIVVGSMSLIGPRPERPHFIRHIRLSVPNFDDRLLVRPGITGWAQVNYPYGASIHDARQKLDYDLHYLRHRSIALDLQIMLMTVRVIFGRVGSR